eukprot:2062747-Alexandrium_andersonii.AAC.1
MPNSHPQAPPSWCQGGTRAHSRLLFQPHEPLLPATDPASEPRRTHLPRTPANRWHAVAQRPAANARRHQ